jgi:hypothetical protein
MLEFLLVQFFNANAHIVLENEVQKRLRLHAEVSVEVHLRLNSPEVE